MWGRGPKMTTKEKKTHLSKIWLWCIQSLNEHLSVGCTENVVAIISKLSPPPFSFEINGELNIFMLLFLLTFHPFRVGCGVSLVLIRLHVERASASPASWQHPLLRSYASFCRLAVKSQTRTKWFLKYFSSVSRWSYEAIKNERNDTEIGPCFHFLILRQMICCRSRPMGRGLSLPKLRYPLSSSRLELVAPREFFSSLNCCCCCCCCRTRLVRESGSHAPTPRSCSEGVYVSCRSVPTVDRVRVGLLRLTAALWPSPLHLTRHTQNAGLLIVFIQQKWWPDVLFLDIERERERESRPDWRDWNSESIFNCQNFGQPVVGCCCRCLSIIEKD